MVVFTCNHCGESVQKPKVDKHYETKCRNQFPDLCCVDCIKDFRGDEFRAHTKCVTEAERYGGNNFVSKPNQNKGEKKQDAWIEIVQSVLDDNTKLSGSLRNLLQRVSQQPNTPRKKPKFMNFIKSMDSRTSMQDRESAWDLLSAKLDLLKNINPAGRVNNNATNGNDQKDEVIPMEVDSELNSEIQEKKKTEVITNGSVLEENDENKPEEKALSKKEKKEKRKREKYEAEFREAGHKMITSEDDETPSKKKKAKLNKVAADISDTNGFSQETNLKSRISDSEEPTKKISKDGVKDFDWTNIILSVVGSKKKDMSLKKLQKKVLTEFCVVNGVSEATERASKKFTKTLYKIKNIKVENDKVRLVKIDNEKVEE